MPKYSQEILEALSEKDTKRKGEQIEIQRKARAENEAYNIGVGALHSKIRLINESLRRKYSVPNSKFKNFISIRTGIPTDWHGVPGLAEKFLGKGELTIQLWEEGPTQVMKFMTGDSANGPDRSVTVSAKGGWFGGRELGLKFELNPMYNADLAVAGAPLEGLAIGKAERVKLADELVGVGKWEIVRAIAR